MSPALADAPSKPSLIDSISPSSVEPVEDKAERVEIDRSMRGPVLLFYGAAIAWLLIGSLLALMTSLKFNLPGFLAEHPGPVDLLHVDADLYSAADTVLTLVGPRLHAGSVVVFDEYFNYPGWQRHEHQAWQEYVERTGTTFSYEAYTYDHEQVVVRVTEP